MLRGRRLPLPQPALLGWSSKPASALTAALTFPAPARSFSSSIRRPSGQWRDPRNLFLYLRQQLQAETEAKRQASKQLAGQKQQTSQATGHDAQRAAPATSEKQSEQTEQAEQAEQAEQSIQPSYHAVQELASAPSEKQNAKTTRPSDNSSETTVQMQANSNVQDYHDGRGSTLKQGDMRATDEITLPVESIQADSKPEGAKQIPVSEESRKASASPSPDRPGTLVSSQQPPQDSIRTPVPSESHTTAGEPTDTKSPHVVPRRAEATDAAALQNLALQNLRALASQMGVDTREVNDTDLKRALMGAKSWTRATMEAKDEVTRQAELEAEKKSPQSPPLPISKIAAGAPEDKADNSPSIEDPNSSGTVASKALGPGFHQQIAPSEPLFTFRKIPQDTSQQAQSPGTPREHSAKPQENVGQAPPSKAGRSEGGGRSAKSIFDMLFQDGGTEKQKVIPSQPKPLTTGVQKGELGPIPMVDKPVSDPAPKSPRPTESIFAKLFPEEAEPEPEVVEAEQPQETLSPPENTIFVSLRNEVRNWIPPEEQEDIVAPKPGDHGSHSTVVTIWGVSHSLVETDFYRIIPEGKHVEGWAGGLVKVVQAREPLNQKPLGRYYLMFHSRPSAIAYVEEVKRLHALSRKLLHTSGTGLSPARGRLDDAPVDPQPFISEEEKAAVRCFTLCSPDAPIKLRVDILTTKMIRQIAANGSIADVVQALRSEADTPAKVLVTVTIPGGGSAEPNKHGLTIDDLWLTLRDDGRERSAPWSLVNLTEGIIPLKMRPGDTDKMRFEAEPVTAQLGLDENEAHYDEDQNISGIPTLDSFSSAPNNDDSVNSGGGNRNAERYNKFILTFQQRPHARRFVRCWHKRTIHDAERDRHVVIDAVALL